MLAASDELLVAKTSSRLEVLGMRRVGSQTSCVRPSASKHASTRLSVLAYQLLAYHFAQFLFIWRRCIQQTSNLRLHFQCVWTQRIQMTSACVHAWPDLTLPPPNSCKLIGHMTAVVRYISILFTTPQPWVSQKILFNWWIYRSLTYTRHRACSQSDHLMQVL